jgi:hypothetical protein
MELWQAVFRNFYTGFLLRDFVGKIVPGVLLLFSICTMYYDPKKLFHYLTKDLPTFTIIFLAGFAWTITLGTQSLADGLRIWRYFPEEPQAASIGTPQLGFWKNLLTRGDDSSFDKDTLQIDEFQTKASEDEMQQYERFVVIKEACGNLFISGLLSIPAWMCGFVTRRAALKTRMHGVWIYATKIHIALGGFYILLIMTGLHRMHAQHVHRQFQFANDLVEKHRNQPAKPTSTPNSDREAKKP